MRSKFIKAEYEDLPFAHASLLTHHPQKLVKKGDIVCTSGNCCILTNESSHFCYMLKKEQKHLRRSQKGRQNGRQHKVKGVKSQKQKKIEESREKTQVNGTICKGFEEQKPAEGHIGPTGEQENKGYAELIEKHKEVEEIQFKVNDKQVEAEQYNEGNEEHNQKQLVEENNQAEDKNQAENHSGVAEEEQKELNKEVMEEQQIQVPAEGYIGQIGAENHTEVAEAQHLKELDKEVIEELCHEEQKNENLEEKNKIQDQESEASEKQARLPEIQIEGVVELINPQQRLLDVPCDSSCGENENKQVPNERTKTVQEENSPTTESHRKFSGEANIFKPKAGQSYLELSLEHQHQTTFSNEAKGLEYKMQKQHQQRGTRPSECEPVLMTIEAEHDLTLASLKSELKQKSMPSTKRMLEPRPQTLVEINKAFVS
ncbi:hypothetical protein Patl1_28063 [Pistacia atlantica]|uniref:Uncharacterized protein n=1 Tax=Pistacia atlantica TaxID=434234 RepID=A0ACC1BD52_9ROSI|nr:hypothetical protein Patl1_28063 [Pistacia atlantica]